MDEVAIANDKANFKIQNDFAMMFGRGLSSALPRIEIYLSAGGSAQTIESNDLLHAKACFEGATFADGYRSGGFVCAGLPLQPLLVGWVKFAWTEFALQRR